MKNKYVIVLFISLLGAMAFSTRDSAPVARIGYVSYEKVITSIPKYREAQAQMDTLVYELNLEIQSKMSEFQQKQQTYVADSARMNPLIRETKLQELQTLSQSIQTFRQSSQREVSRRDSAMIQPILTSVQDAIDAVAAADGYTHILNADSDSKVIAPLLLFAKEDLDVTALVVEKYRETNE